nr:transforming growth factor-beta-induced protein ig-h3 [Parasteatoda tepidariorum]
MRRTIVVRRQCCHGFVRRTDGRPGCSALKMENLYDTMKSLEMTKFLSWMESSGLKDKLMTENLTVFTPSNDAIVDFEDDTEDNEISAMNPAKMTDIALTVSGHIVEGFLNIDSVEDEELLNTLNDQNKIRINKYQPAHEVVTANCVPVSGKNNLATNGIVHLVSGVLPSLKSSVEDILSNNKEYSKFRKLLAESNLLEVLQKDGLPWTLFVPTNAAFRKLPRLLQRQIESGEGCVESILHQHIVKGTICTAAIISQNRVRNILGNNLQLTKDEAEKLRVNGALMESNDIVATNGVIHEIDTVLIPPQARNILKALEEEERQDIIDLIETSDLLSELEQSKNVTFFLPTKEAIKSLSNETKEELLNNPEYLKSVLQHHLVQDHLPSSKFLDNSKLTTMGGHSLHLKLHELFPGIVTGATVQCAFLMSHDNQACGAVIHKINKVLIPPKGSIAEVLEDMPDHSIVMKLLKNTDLESKLKEDGPFTFLAPTDDAFERMTESSLDDLLENNTLAEDILKLHVLPEVLCCNGVPHSSPFHRQFVRTFDGSILPLHRGIGDRVRFGRARALHCDILATNGLVHSINRVIQRQRQRSNLFNMDLWPFF